MISMEWHEGSPGRAGSLAPDAPTVKHEQINHRRGMENGEMVHMHWELKGVEVREGLRNDMIESSDRDPRSRERQAALEGRAASGALASVSSAIEPSPRG